MVDCWAESCKVAQVVFKPDWSRHKNAVSFKRNEQILGIHAHRHDRGITGNLADKGRWMGIPAWRLTAEGGA